jgi:hypothetical protein
MTHGPARSYDSIESLLVDACGHARNRLLHACEAMAWVAGLAHQWRKSYTPSFTLKGAEVQDATAAAGEQAAHVLPGQILIDDKPPWVLARGEATKVAWLARFMVTAAVPTPFNTADSAAEKAGLKEAFRLGCAEAWTRAVDGRRDLVPTYETFLECADRAFQRALHAKRGREAIAAARGDAAARDERLVESLILRVYRVHGVSAKEAARTFPMAQRPA